MLAVELANRESRSSWKEFLEGLKARGLHGVEFVVSDDHPGLKKAIAEVLAGVFWQRCYVGSLKKWPIDFVRRSDRHRHGPRVKTRATARSEAANALEGQSKAK